MNEKEPRPIGGYSGVETAPLGDAPENTLALIHVLSLQIGRAFHARIAAEFDVTIAEWRIMLSLIQRTGATANEIAEEWAIEKMAVSRAVRRLERMNRITRRVNPEDRRSYTLAMTEAGIRDARRARCPLSGPDQTRRPNPKFSRLTSAKFTHFSDLFADANPSC
jgi:DNA-binding MarR family transcriptional regulator